LKRHIRIHLGIKPYKCQFCEATFSDKGACNSHQRTHTGEEREPCPICNVVFSKKQKLRYHMRLHTGEGLENCDICGKTFTHMYALNNHLKMHSRSNGHMCQICKKYIATPNQLLKHLGKHTNRKLSCAHCRKKFSLTKMLNRHIMTVHENVEGFRCMTAQCGVTFFELVTIRQHIREAHSNKHPVYGTHFVDEYNAKPSLDPEVFDPAEDDLPLHYEVLDEEIDRHVLGEKMSTGRQNDDITGKNKGKKTKAAAIKDESGFESDGGLFNDAEGKADLDKIETIKVDLIEQE